MKKLTSLIISTLIMISLIIPAVAADSANFKLKVVSESNSQLVVSIDYEGGETFACLDMEMKYNSKSLKPIQGINGAGMQAFKSEIENNGNMLIAMTNISANPIKFTLATLEDYRNVKDKDMFVITFKKLNSSKIQASDLSIRITNCQTSDSKDVKASIVTAFGGSSVIQTTKNSTTINYSKNTTKSKGITSVGDNSNTSSGETISTTDSDITGGSDGYEITADEGNNNPKTQRNIKRIIIWASAIVCFLLVVSAVVIYLIKKGKNVSTKPDDDKNNTEE